MRLILEKRGVVVEPKSKKKLHTHVTQKVKGNINSMLSDSHEYIDLKTGFSLLLTKNDWDCWFQKKVLNTNCVAAIGPDG